MYFKRMEMIGFKSFADRLEIDFDNGVTAIVGPNGCGKSNVGDAIRWVLGEQSSKALRGNSMQDVIFNGTERRKSLSYCEATLVFDNTDRYFDYEYDEVAVTRKLYRSGESEYLLNRTPCRLKDIVNLFFDSGIGRDGYSIIGQGQVTEIFSAKPENRRQIFEEAAGIAKFRSRKTEAEKKLERTRDNLTRLKDILSERERQLGPLQKQAETAKKFLEFKDSLKDLEVNTYVYQYDNISVAKARINERLSAILEELEQRQLELEKSTNKYNSNMEEINAIDSKIEKLHQDILQLSIAMEQQSGEVKIIRERINNLNQQNDRINLDILNCENFIKKDNAELEYKNTLITEKQQELQVLNKTYEDLSAKYIKTIDDLSMSEDEAENSQKNMLDAMDKIADIKANMSKYKAEKELYKQDSIKLEKNINELAKQIETQNNIKLQAENLLKKADEDRKQASSDYAQNKFKVESLTGAIKDDEEEIHNLTVKMQVFENRRRLLAEMQKEYEGYAYSVKKLLKEAEKNEGMKRKMVGVLASLIKVPEKYETAVEVVLGNALQNIVTFDEQNAKELINFLKQNQFGRATFLPLTTIKPRNILPEDRKYLSQNGCFGIASELIAYHPSIKNIVANLLGSTVIVEDMDIAIKLANNSKFAFRIVTLDGDVVNPQGSMTGGSRKAESANLISREREIESLKNSIAKLQNDFVAKKEEIRKKQKELENIKNSISSLEELKNNSEISFAKATERCESINLTLNGLQNQINEYFNEKNIKDKKVALIDEQLNSIDNLENSASASRSAVDSEIAKRQKLYSDLKAKRDELNSNMTTVRIAIAENETNIKNLGNDIERINENLVVKKAELENFKKEIQRNQNTVIEAEKLIEEKLKTQSNKESVEKLENLKIMQSNLDKNKVDLQAEIKILDEKKNKILEEVNILTDRKFKQEMELSKVDTDLENMQEKIYEEYGLTYETCQPFKRPDFEIEYALKEIVNLKREISKLGYVNVNAIEESKTVLESYNELLVQVQDLETAENELNEIITNLSQEMIVRFKESFDKINDNFKVVFRELFGGGNARLELTDEDNLLDAGVDIVAEPPGKKLQNISLLSGGEKALTAIAILFSILKTRPMPFCLLDEIEAALDDSNVERFAQYLRRFAAGTQFIVITHRKPTMELADRLFGVTMQEKGVSTIVSVKLSDAIKNSAEENK